MQDALQKSVNYVSAKVDLISGGVFDDVEREGTIKTNAAEPNNNATQNKPEVEHKAPERPYSVLVEPTDPRYKINLPGRGYSPEDLDNLVNLLNELPQERVEHIPMAVQEGLVREDTIVRNKKRKSKRRKKKGRQDEDSEC